LAKLKWLEVITPTQEALSSGMVTFRLKKGNSAELVRKLEADHRIVLKAVPATRIVDSNLNSENYNAIRFSTHIYNSEEEIARTVNALREFA
jgi:selenocysteine lyase/cysteine desulfurase